MKDKHDRPQFHDGASVGSVKGLWYGFVSYESLGFVKVLGTATDRHGGPRMCAQTWWNILNLQRGD